MVQRLGSFLAASALCLATATAGQQSFTFDTAQAGDLPAGWSVRQHGTGRAIWQVVSSENQTNKVLAQLGTDNPNKHYNLAVLDTAQFKNVELTVRFKAVAGKHDQGGGFVWRYRDEGNHYIVRANPLENNVVLYKMEAGVRTDLPLVNKDKTYGVKVKPMGFEWHTLKLLAVKDEFTVWLDGEELFKVRDTTFAGPGKVGLWTKADAVSWFDDFAITAK